MTVMERAKFDDRGLLTVIVQDYKTQAILMCAFMNKTALEQTLKTGKMTYYSRSRKKLWVKGEQSGHMQVLKEARFDCDGDALLCRVEQSGGACHEGWASCFAYRVDGNDIVVDGERVFDPEKVYK